MSGARTDSTEVTEDEHIIIRNGTAWSDVCAILGYLDTVTSWNGNFVVIWIMLFMFKLSWQIHAKYQAMNGKNQETNQNQTRKRSKLRELIGVIFILVCPFIFSWIPFVMRMYGVSGLWCWMAMHMLA